MTAEALTSPLPRPARPDPRPVRRDAGWPSTTRTASASTLPERRWARLDAQLADLLADRLAPHVDTTQLVALVAVLRQDLRRFVRPEPLDQTTAIRAVGFTPREVQVLTGMSTGNTNREIGLRLHLTEDTIKTYARRIFTKLDVHDRGHAVARAYQLGILTGCEDQP